MNEYLRAFIIGSSFLVILPYFFVVSFLDKYVSYVQYTFYAPVMLGLFNVLSLLIAKRFNMNREERYMTAGIVAPSIVALTVYTFNVYYDYTPYIWTRHLSLLYSLYFLVFNVIMYLLDKHM